MEKTYQVRKIVRGKVEGKAIVINGSFSFNGDVDIGNGEIIAEGNPHKGVSLNGKVLIYYETKGSSGGAFILQTLHQNGLAPAAIVTVKPVDFNMAEGAIITQTPLVCEPDGDILNEIETGCTVTVDADKGTLVVNKICAEPL